MTEELTIVTPVKSPFNDANTIEKPYEPGQVIDFNKPAEPPASTEPPIGTPPAAASEDIFDSDEFLKKEFGWNNADEAKAAKAELESLRAKAPEIKYGVPEDKQEEYYNLLDKKIKLDKVEKLDATNAANAAQIVKTDLQYKYPNLTADDIDFMYEQKYNLPEKPESDNYGDETEYKSALAKWERQASIVNKTLEVDAKLAQPNIAGYKSQIVLPDITSPAAPQPTQEELQEAERYRNDYIAAVDTGVKAFSGYSAAFKDGEVEVPISYAITEDEKKSLAATLKNFDIIPYFQQRWLDKEGKFKTGQMANDLYLLENPDKVLSKMVNESAAQKEKSIRKANSHINVNGNGRTSISNQQPNSMEAQISHLWKNG